MLPTCSNLIFEMYPGSHVKQKHALFIPQGAEKIVHKINIST
jgi:hypothetical protein